MLLLSTLLACPAPCEGPGCDAVYSATTLSLHRGARSLPARTEQQPLRGELVLRGSEAQGQSQVVILGQDLLLLGLPELAQVRSHRLSELEDGALALQPHGLLQGPEGSRFGASMAAVPDLDGDGVAELWVGAPDLDPGEALPEAGGAYLFPGLGEGFSGEPGLESATLRLAGEAPFDHLGESLRSCGDLDGDGLAELAVVAPWGELEAPMAGRLHLLLSSQQLQGEHPVGTLERSWSSPVEGAAVGRGLDCSQDLDGDGRVELLVGSPFHDAGAPGGGAIWQLPSSSGDIEEAEAAWFSEESEAYLGWTLASGDLDGDGLPELVAGAPGAKGGDGAVWIYDGSQRLQGSRTPQFRVEGREGERLGRAVAVADLDDDGLDDLIIGAPRHDPGEAFAAGALYIFRGRQDYEGWEREFSSEQANGSLVQDQAFLRTGERFALGDTDTDGLPELVLLLEVEP